MTSPEYSGEGNEEDDASLWNWENEKAFENALATVPYPAKGQCAEDRWLELVAARVPGKSIVDVKKHYRLLIEDVSAIEGGRVPIPRYGDDSDPLFGGGDRMATKRHSVSDRKAGNGGRSDSGGRGMSGSKADRERRKGIPWSEEEHRLFLIGLKKFGKGDWRSISRNYVVSRTPTQVASHAQKYFIRANSMNNERRRSSIHDITSVNGADAPASQGFIAGQERANSAPNHSQHPNVPGRYQQPMPGNMISAIGTPVILPLGHVHAPYVVPIAYPPSKMRQ